MKNDVFKFVVEIPRVINNRAESSTQFGTFTRPYRHTPLDGCPDFMAMPAEIEFLYGLVNDVANSSRRISNNVKYSECNEFGYTTNMVPIDIGSNGTCYSKVKKLWYKRTFTKLSPTKDDKQYTANNIAFNAYLTNIDNNDVMRLHLDIDAADGSGVYESIYRGLHTVDDWSIYSGLHGEALYHPDGKPIHNEYVFIYNDELREYSRVKEFWYYVFDLAVGTLYAHTAEPEYKKAD